jgi:hypothetical protein
VEKGVRGALGVGGRGNVSVTKLGAKTMELEHRGYRCEMGTEARDSAASGTAHASSNWVQPFPSTSLHPFPVPIRRQSLFFIIVVLGCDCRRGRRHVTGEE